MEKIKDFLIGHNYWWRTKLIWCLPIFVLLVIFDWVTKAVAVSSYNDGFQGDIINGFLHFNFLVNFGSAYGANAQNVALTISLATMVTLVMMIGLVFIQNKLWMHTINIFFAGAFGNLIARSWAPVYEGRTGGVVDFISFNPNLFPEWVPKQIYLYSFNLADLYVNIAVVLLVICTIILVINEVRLHLLKKQDEVFEQLGVHDLRAEALGQKLIQDIKGKNLLIQFYLYCEWKTNLKINKIEYHIFYQEAKLQLLINPKLQAKKAKSITKLQTKLMTYQEKLTTISEKIVQKSA